MKSRTAEETMCLLTGAALGAAALYFLDPSTGRRRRNRVVAAAEGVLGDIVGAAQTGASAVSRSAKHLGDHLSADLCDEAHDLSGQAHDIASGLTERATGYLRQNQRAAMDAGHHIGQRWMDQARYAYQRARGATHNAADAVAKAANTDDWRRWAAKNVSRASHKTQAWLGHDHNEGFGAGTLLSSTVGCCAVGAGIMYFMDPQRGGSRRTWVAEKTLEFVHQTGQRTREMGQDIANHLRSTVRRSNSAARGYVSRTQVDSEELLRRIREEVGQFMAYAHQVQFMANREGEVTVTGDIRKDEISRLLTFLHTMPGVTYVINRTKISDSAASMPTTSPMPR